jgi:hypothetical protein
MQQAYKPAMATSPAQDLMSQTGHTVVLWSPEHLNLSHKQVGIQKVEARHFVIFTDQVFHSRDESEAIFQADLNAPRAVVRQVKTAFACAYEVIIQHAARGVVILDSFLDVPVAKVEALENKLKQAGWFEAEKIPQLKAILEGIKASDAIERTAIDDLKNAVETTITYRMARLDDSMGEAQRAKEGNMGRATLTREERTYYEEIGLELPESVTQSAVNPAASFDGNAVAELMASNNQAMIDVMASAMNNFATTLINQMKGGQPDGNEKESGAGKTQAGKESVQRKAA